MYSELDELIGKKIKRIFFNESYLKFETDKGDYVYGVDGDCCSNSYFHDFIGVKKLLENGPVISVEQIPLELNRPNKNDSEYVQCYGFQIITENEQFGKQTSVMSFRNSSNGYYGGSLMTCTNQDVNPEIFDDVIEAVTPSAQNGEK